MIPIPVPIVIRPAVAVMGAVAVTTIPLGIIVGKAAGQQTDGRDQQKNALFYVTSW